MTLIVRTGKIEVETAVPSNEELLFDQFKAYHRQFLILLSEGFFDMKGGSITCHFDNEGLIRKVEKSVTSFYT